MAMFALTAAQRETLRARLAERRRLLGGEIEQGLHEASSSNAEADRPDGPVADLESAIAVAEIERDAAELNAVLDALARLDEGDYGLCTDCGGPIAFERLNAQPQAPRCIRCETERDRLRARPSPPAL